MNFHGCSGCSPLVLKTLSEREIFLYGRGAWLTISYGHLPNHEINVRCAFTHYLAFFSRDKVWKQYGPKQPALGGLQIPDGLVVGSCTSHPRVLGSIPKREEPGETGAPCVKVPGSSRVPPTRWLLRGGQSSPHTPRLVVSRILRNLNKKKNPACYYKVQK
jgi:hypothetical protein